MSAFIAELEARFDDEHGRDLDALIDELTDAERASVTLSPAGVQVVSDGYSPDYAASTAGSGSGLQGPG